MPERLHQGKQPVSAALAGPYGHPFHPILVTVPIGAWVASLVFDVASRFVADPAFLTQGSVWLIGIGVIGAVAAAVVGLLDLFAIPADTAARRLAVVHMSLNLLVIASYAGNLGWRQLDYGQPVPVAAGPLALSAVTLAVLALSGFLGGKLTYTYGIRVADESTQAAGFGKGDRSG